MASFINLTNDTYTSSSAINSIPPNLMATASIAPVWLYQPQRPEILQQLIRLSHEEHVFVALTKDSYNLIGYLADGYQVSPIYCAGSHQQGQTWFNRLDQVGWLVIEGDTTCLYPLFKAMPAGSEYISAISSAYCTPGAQGDPLPTWLIPSSHPAPFDAMSTLSMELNDMDYNFWGLSTIASASGIGELTGPISDEPNEAPIEELVIHPDLKWRSSTSGQWGALSKAQRAALTHQMKRSPWWRIVMLTRFLFIGGLWVGENLHPFSTTPLDVRHSVTNCFLTALDIVNKNYQQILAEPVHITFATGESITAGWLVFCLSKSLDNTKSDLKKVVKGAMSPLTNFCIEGEMQERITYFVLLLESGDGYQVQRAIQELTVHQVFKELLWTSLFQPIKKLADGYQHGRIADLYPEEIFSRYKCLAQKLVCNLLTFLYYTMTSVLSDINSDDIEHPRPEEMRDILMSASNKMYEKPHLFPQFTEAVKILPFLTGRNVLGICKGQLPMYLPDRTRRRNMSDVMDIETQPVDEAFDDVPNNQGFSSTMSLRYIWDLPVSYFTKHG
ncbi:hypothetical protein DFH29DRAFT_1005347 [Suillus ampliporus]|nr:hypothetical protein DFH29DRAFT_1005347 [Suillus ampliporus]